MQPTLLDQGLTLMLVGMGTVFVFLTILVAAMSLMALVVKQLTPAAETAGVTDEEVAAITAAISQHRKARTSTH
jgi:oxaloacetate decarboxylase gamma subunit